ncbi:MAG: phosphoribosylanthranilate isomerase [Odoribacter splanchnicus]|nr:phosphoribosylanthranilate isomerase [Odoribacter splanchnicus]
MLIKVCGMREPGNIAAVASLCPDMLGFIFYPLSPRYAGNLLPEAVHVLPPDIQRTGVFVNEEEAVILGIAERYRIDTIQLHGAESPEFCRKFRDKGFRVVKAIGIGGTEDLEACGKYEGCCDMLLFDTKSPKHGGTGRGFDWELLGNYRGKLPFLLSGGIGPADALRIKAFGHTRLAGIDLNSRFEIAPGVKDYELLSAFMEELRR